MPRIVLPEGASVHCIVDDFLWPWDGSTPVLMMHGFARNAAFWNLARCYAQKSKRKRGPQAI